MPGNMGVPQKAPLKRRKINSPTGKISKNFKPNNSTSKPGGTQPAAVSTSGSQAGASASSSTQGGNPPANNQVDITSKPKPIMACISMQSLMNYIKCCNSSFKMDEIAIASISARTAGGAKKVRISCSTLDTKKKIIELLSSKQVAMHSFTETTSKSAIFVLKGYDVDHNPTEILKDLQAANIPATKVTTIVKSTDNSNAVHLVHFGQDSTSLSVLNKLHRRFNGANVRWEAQDPAKKRHTQCHKCQRWGHSSNNCYHQDRCVKCLGTHRTEDCNRKDRDDQVKCVNCEGNHAANFRGCSAAKQYVKSIKPRPTRVAPRPISKQIDWNLLNEEDFPNSLNQEAPANQSKNKKASAAYRLVNARQKPDIRRANTAVDSDDDDFDMEDQDHTTHPVSFTPKPSPSPELVDKFKAAQKKYSELNMEQTMIEFIQFVDELSHATTKVEKFSIIAKFNGVPLNVN